MAFRCGAARVARARAAARAAVRVVSGRVDASTVALRAPAGAHACASRADCGRRTRRAARAAIASIAEEIHASARALVRAGGARAVELSAARTTLAPHVTRAAVLVVVREITADGVTGICGRAGAGAAALDARRALGTHRRACTAARDESQVDTAIAAERERPGAHARTGGAARALRARVVAGAAVERVGRDRSAEAAALASVRRAHALRVTADLAQRASTTARTAIGDRGLEVDARAAAIGATRRAHAALGDHHEHEQRPDQAKVPGARPWIQEPVARRHSEGMIRETIDTAAAIA